jgi:hypothetical protein
MSPQDSSGYSKKKIQERLEHSTFRMTFDRYGHLFPSLDERLCGGLEAGFREAVNSRRAEDRQIEAKAPSLCNA